MKNARTFGSYYRKPRTKQEKSINFVHRLEGIKVRQKRFGANLPDSYDDLCNSKSWSISWKDLYKKKKQWLNKNIKPHGILPYRFRQLDVYFECPSLEKFLEGWYCYRDCPFYLKEDRYCLKYKKHHAKRKLETNCYVLNLLSVLR